MLRIQLQMKEIEKPLPTWSSYSCWETTVINKINYKKANQFDRVFSLKIR